MRSAPLPPAASVAACVAAWEGRSQGRRKYRYPARPGPHSARSHAHIRYTLSPVPAAPPSLSLSLHPLSTCLLACLPAAPLQSSAAARLPAPCLASRRDSGCTQGVNRTELGAGADQVSDPMRFWLRYRRHGVHRKHGEEGLREAAGSVGGINTHTHTHARPCEQAPAAASAALLEARAVLPALLADEPHAVGALRAQQWVGCRRPPISDACSPRPGGSSGAAGSSGTARARPVAASRAHEVKVAARHLWAELQLPRPAPRPPWPPGHHHRSPYLHLNSYQPNRPHSCSHPPRPPGHRRRSRRSSGAPGRRAAHPRPAAGARWRRRTRRSPGSLSRPAEGAASLTVGTRQARDCVWAGRGLRLQGPPCRGAPRCRGAWPWRLHSAACWAAC